MKQWTLSVAFLISFFLHGALGAFLWSLRAGEPEPSLGIVEVFPVSESVPSSASGKPLIPQRSIRNEPRPLAPQPPLLGARTPVSVAAPLLLPASPDPMPPSEDPLASRPSSETPVALAVLPRSKEEVKPGPGLPGGKDEIVTDRASPAAMPGPLILPSGGYQVRPAYPEVARRMGIEGTTSLKVRVREDGTVGEVIVAQPAGHAALDQAAVNAVQRWRFEPARRGGHPVAVWVSLAVRFRLE